MIESLGQIISFFEIFVEKRLISKLAQISTCIKWPVKSKHNMCECVYLL